MTADPAITSSAAVTSASPFGDGNLTIRVLDGADRWPTSDVGRENTHGAAVKQRYP